ncbi:MAG: MFS transporter, partial [Chloroflexota bacterium]
VVFFFVKEPARTEHHREVSQKRPSILSVLMLPAFAGALLLTLAAQLAATASLPIIPLFVQDLLGGARNVATDTGWVLALSGVTGAAGAYLAGRLQRHIGLRPLLIATIALSAILLVPQALAANYLQFLVLRSVAAFAFGGLFGMVGITAALSSPIHAKGTAFGLMGAASSIGFGCGPLLGGALAAASGLRVVFVASALLLAIGPLLVALASAAIGARRFRLATAR